MTCRRAASIIVSNEVKLPLGVPKLIDQDVIDFCKSISASEPSRIAVSPAVGARELQCYFNVQTASNIGMGTPAYGWLLWLFPNMWLEAHHHSVLRNHKDVMIDLTPQPDGETEVLFLPDTARPFDLNRPRPTLKRRLCLTNVPEIHVWINALEALEKFEWQHSRFIGENIETKVSEIHDVRRYNRLKSEVQRAELNAFNKVSNQ